MDGEVLILAFIAFAMDQRGREEDIWEEEE